MESILHGSDAEEETSSSGVSSFDREERPKPGQRIDSSFDPKKDRKAKSNWNSFGVIYIYNYMYIYIYYNYIYYIYDIIYMIIVIIGAL